MPENPILAGSRASSVLWKFAGTCVPNCVYGTGDSMRRGDRLSGVVVGSCRGGAGRYRGGTRVSLARYGGVAVATVL